MTGATTAHRPRSRIGRRVPRIEAFSLGLTMRRSTLRLFLTLVSSSTLAVTAPAQGMWKAEMERQAA